MSSGPEGETMPSRRSRIYDGICSNSCGIQEPLDVAGGSIYDNAVQRAVQKPRWGRRYHFPSRLCLRDTANTVSGGHKDPSPAPRDGGSNSSATVCGLVVGRATLGNVQVTRRAISTIDLIRQQHLSRLYPHMADHGGEARRLAYEHPAFLNARFVRAYALVRHSPPQRCPHVTRR
jgi:hypothetical protein